MNIDELKEMFPDMEIIEHDIGDRVICDDCNKEWTNDPTMGGLLFNRKAICPDCAQRWRDSAKKYNEEQYITENTELSFYEFVLSIR